MICPHCAASISEDEEKCPYCDSFIDNGKKQFKRVEPVNLQDVSPFRLKGDDKPIIPLVLISACMPIGMILMMIFIICGRPKSALASFAAAFIGAALCFLIMVIYGFTRTSHYMMR
jgi:uncharacterized membrane protein YvbJ